MQPWYATRQMVQRALDITPNARTNQQIDRALATASRRIDSECFRRFYPERRTLTLDWPNDDQSGQRVWLDENELVAATAITTGDGDITTSVFLRPDTGPPFNRLDIDDTTNASWAGANSRQRAISITGIFGYRLDYTRITALNGGINNTVTTLTVDDSSAVGVGTVLLIGAEWLIVTGMTLATTGQTLGADLTAMKNNTEVEVADAMGFTVDEEITIDSERMRIADITDATGDTLHVERAQAGLGALAAHTAGATIYAPRALVVQRGALGSTATSHADDTLVYRWDPPPLIQSATIGLAIDAIGLEQAGMSGQSGSGATAKAVSGGAQDGRAAVVRAYRRRARSRAV